jgi:hypothetical protein
MRTWKSFPRAALVISLLLVLCAGLFAPRVEQVGAKPLAACPGGIITQWTFWDGTTTTTSPSTGTGVFTNGTGLTPPTPPYTFFAGNPDQAISFSGWAATFDANDYVEFSVDTTGRSDISFRFDYRSTATGPTNLDLQYSTDGSSFSSFVIIGLVRDATFHVLTYDLSTIPGLNNNPNTKIRLYGYGSTGGNLRLDNVTISETCPTPTPTETLTPTLTFTPSNTPPFSPTPTLTPAPGEVVISEVAWSGTLATTNDEWIELYNTRSTPIDISGWRLVSDSGAVDIVLNGIIPGNGFFLLERARELTVSDVPSHQIYFGTLPDTGDALRLSKPEGTIVDTANGDGGSWPAGTGSTTFYSMERLMNGSVVAPDTSAGWVSNNQPTTWFAHDAASNLIHGTPGSPNFNFIATITPTLTQTRTFTPTITPTSSGIRSVIINEIAWAGTASGLADDEWIELYNPSGVAIDLTDWELRASDGTPTIILDGIIPAGGYFLLERDDDTVVSDIAANQIYTGALSNSGEILSLVDTSNKVIDTANGNGGGWPRGSSSTYGTMERIANTTDSDSAWVTNGGSPRNGKNANGGDIMGTPKNKNTTGPTPTPSRTPTATRTLPPPTVVIDPRPIINEILPRPGYDWNGDGRVDVFDEFIEIKNLTAININLKGWRLDDEANLGSDPYTLPDLVLKPGERAIFYALETNILLSDGGDTVRLINPSGKIYDAYTYAIARVEDQSICRLPDGNPGNSWFEDCIPTPNLTNSREGSVPSAPGGNAESPVCDLPDTIPADFFFAECRGYGAGIWNPLFWDATGWMDKHFLPSITGKWKSFVE